MARLDLNRRTLPEFTRRIGSLSAGSQRRWGKMDATRMLRHLTFTAEMSLGLSHVDPQTPAFARPIIYLVFFKLWTNWPKGKIKAPDAVCPPPMGDFESERRVLSARLNEFVDLLEREPARVATNPGLGPIPISKWSRVHGVHCDHHLRQFGV